MGWRISEAAIIKGHCSTSAGRSDIFSLAGLQRHSNKLTQCPLPSNPLSGLVIGVPTTSINLGTSKGTSEYMCRTSLLRGGVGG